MVAEWLPPGYQVEAAWPSITIPGCRTGSLLPYLLVIAVQLSSGYPRDPYQWKNFEKYIGTMFWHFYNHLFSKSIISTIFFHILKFYWRIVDLQCYDHFCCPVKRFSSTDTHIIHSFWDSFPKKIIREYCAEFPVLYNRSPLASHSTHHSVYRAYHGFVDFPITFLSFPKVPQKVTLLMLSLTDVQ